MALETPKLNKEQTVEAIKAATEHLNGLIRKAVIDHKLRIDVSYKDWGGVTSSYPELTVDVYQQL